MPTKSQLRKRRNADKQSTQEQPTTQPAPPPPPPPQTRADRLIQALSPLTPYLPYLRIPVSLFLGIITAASFSSLSAGISLFILTVLTIFFSLLFVTMSILRDNDQANVYMPDVHNPDGTVVKQQQMTVFQHDNKVIKHFARELPALALATVWFYLWSLIKPTFAIYAAFVAFRLLFHPLFRIHLWREQLSRQLGRPFGAVPLFDNTSKVVILEGDEHFQRELQSTETGSLVIVDCSATWCPPCKQMAPIFERLSEQFPQHKFLSVDIDISRDIATNLVVTSVPSFIIFKDGQRMEMIKGASPEKLHQSIQSYT